MSFPSERQRDAIEAELGPVLVIAGPGAGKTSCLVARIEHLIEARGVAPSRICAVTFTNKAAEEVANRLKRTLGRSAEEITRGTIHALCLTILRAHSAHAGLQAGFGVADEEYQKVVLGRLKVPRKYRGNTLTLFGRHRLQGYELTPRDQRLYTQYRELLHGANMADFDDLVVLTASLLTQNPAIADEIAGQWDYLLVDECQDLNQRQYQILTRLAAPHRNIFVVGDDEQSIFSWAGADPGILTRFGKDFGIEQPIVLEENCRCSQQVFAAARRLIAQNPQLFAKQLRATRQSPHEVAALSFPDEDAEAEWIVADLLADRAGSGEPWGEFGILYRRHESGERLETRLLTAGIPCRLSRGRAIGDDTVIAQVLASLRVMIAPGDPVAVEALAELVLPAALLDQVRARYGGDGLLRGLRLYALEHRGDAASKPWRFIYSVENLKAIYRSHQSLQGLVDAILSQGVGAYRNPLEADSVLPALTDPERYPGAAALASDLQRINRTGGRIWILPANGLEFALRGMVAKAGYSLTTCGPVSDSLSKHDLILDPSALPGIGLRLFKALQLEECRSWEEPRGDYTTFDLETTDNDIADCEIVEIGAVRVRDGQITERFQSLVHCVRAISPRATQVHGFRDADLAGAPEFSEIWSRFRAFIGGDILIAHNGQKFDVPVLRRMAEGLDGVDDLVFYDSLPLARSVSTLSAKLADIAARYGVETGRSHHALDDAEALAQVYGHLLREKSLLARKTARPNLLDHLGLVLALDGFEPKSESAAIFEIARRRTLGRFGESLNAYQESRHDDSITLEEAITRLGGSSLMDSLRAERSAEERYPAAVARLRGLTTAGEGQPLETAIGTLLDRVALSRSEGVEIDRNRVNLLTLHATKGLEFSRVYVVGVEDNEMPGNQALANQRLGEIEEARRVLYVGMTRAKDRLVLSRAQVRRGQPAGASMFLQEIGIAVVVSAPISV